MPKDKEGNKLTWKEFMARWKSGILAVTPYQMAYNTFRSTWIIIIGIILGMFVSLDNLKTLWWLLVILVGALFNTIIVQIGNYQKLNLLGRFK